MTDNDKNLENHVEAIKSQILDILNKVKEETGVDMPVDIQVRSTEDE